MEVGNTIKTQQCANVISKVIGRMSHFLTAKNIAEEYLAKLWTRVWCFVLLTHGVVYNVHADIHGGSLNFYSNVRQSTGAHMSFGDPIVTIWNVVFANKSEKLGWICMKRGRWG